MHLGRLKDAGTLRTEQVSFGKYHNVHAALEVAHTARSVLGANGITLEYPVLRHANNLESVLHVRGHARDAHADPRPGHHGPGGVHVVIALRPVISRATISDWMLSVPSKVKIASMSACWRATWFSSRIPLPPRMSRAMPTISRALAA